MLYWVSHTDWWTRLVKNNLLNKAQKGIYLSPKPIPCFTVQSVKQVIGASERAVQNVELLPKEMFIKARPKSTGLLDKANLFHL